VRRVSDSEVEKDEAVAEAMCGVGGVRLTGRQINGDGATGEGVDIY
jgi:hypothetical protein